MKMIIGLGNPGPQYLLTRHNIGFIVIDVLNREFGDGSFRQEHKAEVAKVRLESQAVLLVKPLTYMNLSGESVRSLKDYYNVELDNLLVAHDDIDQPYGAIRYQKNRGPGGHNGIKSLIQHLHTKDFDRLKLGVGRPSNPRVDVSNHVLQDFSKEEQNQLADWLGLIVESIECYVSEGIEKVANKYNGRFDGSQS